MHNGAALRAELADERSETAQRRSPVHAVVIEHGSPTMPFLKALLFGFRFLPQPMSAGTHRYNPLPTCRYFVAVDKNEAPLLAEPERVPRRPGSAGARSEPGRP